MASNLVVPFAGVKDIPDPTKIVTTWEWYFLDQVSSSLIKWDSRDNAFQGVLSESWTNDNGTVTFKLRSNIKFSNGEPITSIDVAKSVKRALLKKSSSHFRPWELLRGCESLTNIDQECEGIEILSDEEIKFHLRYPSESFFLFMACPEGSIWWSGDLVKEVFKPTGFSGAYKVAGRDESALLLEANQLWPLSQRFPQRPHNIRALWGGEADLRNTIISGKFDIVLDLERPFGDATVPNGFAVRGTAFNSLYYLFGTSGRSGQFSRECLKEIWSKNFPEALSPAHSFLPFDSLSGIGEKEILELLPAGNCSEVRIGYLKGYFTEEFLHFLFKSEPNFKIVPMSSSGYMAAFSKDYQNADVDFVLTPYVASERYPSVQISFLMEDREIPFDLSILDHRDLNEEKKKMIHDVQAWTIKTQQIIPLVFGRSKLIYRKELNVGNQPLVDSELQLWRVNE